MKKLKIISLVVLAIFLHSCRKDFQSLVPILPIQDSLSFKSDIFPMVIAYGCDCHDNGSIPPKFLNADFAFTALQGNSDISGTPYIVPGDALLSPFYISLTSAYGSNQMPAGNPNKLSIQELETVKNWINQGAAE